MERRGILLIVMLLSLTLRLWADDGPRPLPPLDARHLLVDGSLSDAEVQQRPFVFNDLRQAMSHLADSTTLYIRPWVYWVDNPDTPRVVKGQQGREPFGMVVRTRQLSLIGLGRQPSDVVLASQRGQTQGADGNFTMFDFHTDSLYVENLTMGNYCNVDLDYALRPELSRPKRSATITQAHVGYVHGRWLVARRVRFISRLNLNPLNGARQSLYDSCHFECTDDALNGGNAVYRHCDFDLYGQKPWWSTFGAGPLLVDCDFYVKGESRETYFCKQGGALTLVGCRYHVPGDSCYVGWTAYPQPWLRCYQQDFTLNGRPYIIGQRQPQNTVVLTGQQPSAPLFLPISRHEATLRSPARLVLRSEQGASWVVPPAYVDFVQCREQGDSVEFMLTNNGNETISFCITALTADLREAACHVSLLPGLLPAPRFLRTPEIKVSNGVARLDYKLQLADSALRDASVITWQRDGIVVSTSHTSPQRTYPLSQADVGHRLKATIVPRHQRSTDTAEVSTAEMMITEAPRRDTMDTDFHDFPTQWQPQLVPGYWTVDGYKPADTADYQWTFDCQKPMWAYAEGFNGAVGHGLVQAQRGARLMFTPPADRSYGDMELTLLVDPTKTAGQGFGSATGQYMDVCLKFDTRTLTGYGLRIVRTVKHAKAVDFLLVEYRNGQVTPLTQPVSATCYRTGCTIGLSFSSGMLSAHVSTATPRPAASQLPHEVHLQAAVGDNAFGGVHIQHTGTCGESTTMLHRLNVRWR